MSSASFKQRYGQAAIKAKDLVVTLSAGLKVSEKCATATLKANGILELTKINIFTKEEIITPLYIYL